MTRLINRREFLERTGDSRNRHIVGINSGTIPQPLEGKGSYRQHWPDYEAEQVVLARVAGYTDEQMRQLVREIHAARPRARDRIKTHDSAGAAA
jgi:hypothetical protein